ncbi:uncharacterized protein LOC122859830 [Aphidius gifuensis]|uniref:uncharacterized protein LOC122859830 n=1 Tax=Aphidius gifuensis TaxID=684658 RepID=UPI001CDC5F79|nr:uncharacterized protein LOC122859830 [Aphidius gifuensis]
MLLEELIEKAKEQLCEKWKSIIDDSWFNVKKLELTHWQYDEYPNYLKKNYSTTDEQFNFLKSLLDKCGRYLTELDLTAYGHCIIVPVINESCPNLVKLRIRIEIIDDAILDNAFTGLSKLKVLKIIFQCFIVRHTYVPVTLINSLLNVADTLTELSLSNWTGCMLDSTNFPEEFTSVVSKLKALERIQIGGINCSKKLVSYFSLRSPGVIAHYEECTYQENKIYVIQKYEDIKKFHIRKYTVVDDFLYNVANQMRQLNTLQIYCERVTDAGMVAISKINSLRTFECYGYTNVTDSSIKLLKNMLFLILPFSNKITNESAIKVLENSPDMYYFSVKNTSVTSEFIKKAEEISRKRKKKLRVVIPCENGMSETQLKYDYLTIDYVKKEKQLLQ